MTHLIPATRPTAASVVRSRGLTKHFGSLVAADQVDLDVAPGDVYGLLGPNGAGTSTVLRMVLGLVRPDGGDLTVHGRPVWPQPDRIRHHVGGGRTPRFHSYLSGRRNLELLARADGGGPTSRIDEVLHTVGLPRQDGALVRDYPKGRVRRLGIAASLLRDPRLLVLDEPTSGLDLGGSLELRALLRRLGEKGLTILLSSHDVLEIDQVCTQVAIARRGRVTYHGQMARLRDAAGPAARLLETSDNHRAWELCRRTPSVTHVRVEGPHVVFDADDPTVERLSRDLVHAGLAIRRLHAPTPPLEALFRRLTDAPPGPMLPERE